MGKMGCYRGFVQFPAPSLGGSQLPITLPPENTMSLPSEGTHTHTPARVRMQIGTHN